MSVELSLITTNADQTVRVGEYLGRLCRAGDVIALEGELGAGKTQLVRGVAVGVGLDPGLVSSPTFVIVSRYDGVGARLAVVHMDAYRLTEGSGLDELGIDAAGMDDAVTLVEWASRVSESLRRLSHGALAEVRLSHEGDERRLITMVLPESWRHRAQVKAIELLAASMRGVTRCPITGKDVPAESPTWPFADEHARRADLGAWLLGKYRLEREASQEDLEEREDR